MLYIPTGTTGMEGRLRMDGKGRREEARQGGESEAERKEEVRQSGRRRSGSEERQGGGRESRPLERS